jgi:hypothetical protein
MSLICVTALSLFKTFNTNKTLSIFRYFRVGRKALLVLSLRCVLLWGTSSQDCNMLTCILQVTFIFSNYLKANNVRRAFDILRQPLGKVCSYSVFVRYNVQRLQHKYFGAIGFFLRMKLTLLSQVHN